ncbi:16481_t:CDS:2 [Racocetra fulgida]|uniref:16481_t:CDS:1 n=1 Tax=Racocetra fulgida TaxID=60492 RepID=A0A9N8VUX1_9GLOM|nr:16481_t:CDS:2 [Racocetra fulgida]
MLKFVDNKLSSKIGMKFKVWDWQIPELYGIVLGMFVKLGLKNTLGIRKSEMLDFIIDVEKGYFKTSYHSFYHAVDVVAVLYYILTDLGAAKYLTSLDAICLLIAGLCHDIGHVNARTDLAIRYNDQSVLENHSCTLTMDIITNHGLFRNVHSCSNEYLGCDPKNVDIVLKDLITKTILATDMSYHFDLLESLHNMIKSISPCSSEESGEEIDNDCTSSASSISSSPENSAAYIKSSRRYQPRSRRRASIISTTLDSEQRELLLKVLLHAADLSNTVRPWDISKRWSDLVVDEFFHQGDLEKQNNLPVSPNMDRKKAHQCQISLGFGDFVVKPYFEAFASFLHEATIFLDILAENRILWDDMKNAPPPPPTLLTPIPDESESESSNEVNDDDYCPKGQRRVSLAAGLLIIPDDIQEKLRLMSLQRHPKHHRKLKRSLSGRSYTGMKKSCDPNSTNDHDENSSSTLNPSSSDLITKPNSTNSHYTNGKKSNNQKKLGRMRRSSSLDHNMIRQITSSYGTGDSQPEQRVVVAGS